MIRGKIIFLENIASAVIKRHFYHCGGNIFEKNNFPPNHLIQNGASVSGKTVLKGFGPSIKIQGGDRVSVSRFFALKKACLQPVNAKLKLKLNFFSMLG